ncbi:MAG TPA: RagB/SusD family nutrient uptake outer membrane protein, partial [Sphingobacterium sp.]|nr:RagB/SusD family nutrient uptake outer membrane protein [Sphingobacterium sp.]
MKNILYMLFGVVVFNLYACERAVEVTPTSDITQASFWKTEGDAQGALNGMYARLRTVSAEDLFMLGEGRGETLARARAGTVGYDKYYEQTLTVNNAGPSWLGIYAAIDASNLLIKYVPGISFNSEADKNNILAQAYTNRAFMYYVLVRTYGGVPIRTVPTESYDPATIHLERSTTEQVFDVIKDDLEKALDLYPNNNFPAGRVKWSRAAASALKGDVYL